MKKTALLKTGVIGSIVLGLCCFTPILVLALTAAGLAVWVAYLDLLLLPSLLFFVLLTVYAVVRKSQENQ